MTAIFYPGKCAFVCIDSIGSGGSRLEGPPDNNNPQLNASTWINFLLPISFNNWNFKAGIEFADIGNITSLGHKQKIPGEDFYTVTCSGPHALSQLTGLQMGLRYCIYLGYAGNAGNARMLITNLTTPTAFIYLRCWCAGFGDVINAEGFQEASVVFESDAQPSIISIYPTESGQTPGLPV
jgi:hypothetical protein